MGRSPEARWGIKLPVVRERQFQDVMHLFNIPTSSAFRCALRIYGLSDRVVTGETERVQIYSHSERLLKTIDLPFKGSPAYAQVLSLTEGFPETRVPDRTGLYIERIQVRVESPNGRKLWAFVSAVSNTRSRSRS